MKTKLFLCLSSFVCFGFLSQAMAADFPDCPQNVTPRSRMDFFCPKLEGSYFPSCCPLVSKSAPISCFYYTESSVATQTLSSATSCEGGVNVTVQCCNFGRKPCNANVKEAPYIQRLFKGNGDQCCYDDCPSASYWSSTRGNTYGVTTQHKRYGRTRPEDCSAVAEDSPNTCGSVTTNCASLAACPVIPTPGPVTPTPTPTPEPSPTPTPVPPTPPPTPPSPPPTVPIPD